MVKKSRTPIANVFEKLEELGGSTVKKTASSVQNTFSPVKLTETALGSQNEVPSTKAEISTQEKKHTPLDVEKLKKEYGSQDTPDLTLLRNRLFQYVKEGEQKAQNELEQEKKERQQSQLRQEEGKKKQDIELKKHQEEGNLPRGKQRRSIFSPKRKAQQQHAETRPASGKD